MPSKDAERKKALPGQGRAMITSVDIIIEPCWKGVGKITESIKSEMKIVF